MEFSFFAWPKQMVKNYNFTHKNRQNESDLFSSAGCKQTIFLKYRENTWGSSIVLCLHFWDTLTRISDNWRKSDRWEIDPYENPGIYVKEKIRGLPVTKLDGEELEEPRKMRVHLTCFLLLFLHFFEAFYHFITVLLHAQIRGQGKSEIEIVKNWSKIKNPSKNFKLFLLILYS